jgi:diguanylate cyclase (GGDEF)-like protein/PAS domain S-box-containing protein
MVVDDRSAHAFRDRVFDQSLVCQLLVDAESGRIVDANPAALAFYGSSLGELTDRAFHSLSVDGAPEVERALSNARAGARVCFRTRQETPGAVRDVEVCASPIRLDTGQIALHAIVQDITERALVEDSLRQSAEDYRLSEERFRDLFDNAPIGYHEVDAEGRLTRVNRTEAAMLGYSPEEMVGRNAWEFVVESISREAIVAKFAGTMPLLPFERTFRRKDGTHLPVLLEDRLIHDAAGRASAIRTTVFDISERKRAEQALRHSEERYRHLVELSPDAIVLHCGGRIIFVNDAAVQLMRAKRGEDLIGRRALDFIHPDSRLLAQERGQRLREEAVALRAVEQKLLCLDGSVVDAEVAVMRFPYHGEVAVQVVARDVTVRKLAEEKIRQLAYHDALTGLPNRILFNDRLTVAVAQAHRQSQKVGLIFIDLDHFKTINDTLGHGVGDQLLKAVADRVCACVREGDTLARLGGDEFTLLLPGLVQASDAVRVAEKVLGAMRAPFTLGSNEVAVTASLGVSIYPDDGAEVEALLKNSDVAMYRAKERGRDNIQVFALSVSSIPAPVRVV